MQSLVSVGTANMQSLIRRRVAPCCSCAVLCCSASILEPVLDTASRAVCLKTLVGGLRQAEAGRREGGGGAGEGQRSGVHGIEAKVCTRRDQL